MSSFRQAVCAVPVLGSFQALTESKTRIKMVVTWQLIKGGTLTTPLLSYEDGKKDLGMIFVSNTISKEVKQSEDTSHVKESLEEFKDRFEGIGKLTNIRVDLNVDPEFKPIA